MSSGRRRERSKNDTWGEKELAKYISGGKDAAKKKLSSTDPYGSTKGYPSGKPSGGSSVRKERIPQSKSETPKKTSSTDRSDTMKASSSDRKDPRKTSSTDRSDPRKTSSTDRSNPRKTSSTDRSDPRKTSSTDRSDLRKTSSTDRSDPRKTSSTDRSNPRKTSSTDRSDPRKTSSSASKTMANNNTKRESKLPDGQGTKSEGEKRRIKDSKHQKESKSSSKDSKLHGKEKNLGKESTSRQSSERDGDHHKSSRSSIEKQVDKEEHRKRTDRVKSNEDNKTSKDLTSKTQTKENGSMEPPASIALEEERKKPGVTGPQPMVEVLEDMVEEEYQYDDEFEADYEDDFNEIAEEEDTEGTPSSVSDEGGEVPVSPTHSNAGVSPSEDGEVPATPTNADVGIPPSDSKAVVMKAMDLVEIMQAMDAENQLVEETTSPHTRVGSVSHDQELNRDKSKSGGGVNVSSSRKFVDFSSAQRKEVSQKVSKKTRKRGQELLSMIELDIAAYDMFDLPPLSEYEVYVRKFGADNTRQASVQTGEDNIESGVQTEEIVCEEKWTQCPPEDLRGYGGPSLESDESVGEATVSGESAIRLASFLSKAGQVCAVLLEENLVSIGGTPFHSAQSPFPFCSSSLTLQAPSYLSNYEVRGLSHSPSQPHLLLATYCTANPHHTPLNSEGVVLLWSTREPSSPQMVLVCQSRPTCTCFSPHKSSLAFAGTDDGSVVLWDLREPASMHRRMGEEELLTRVPTFSTAGIPQLDNHCSPLVSITPISADTAPSHTILSQEEGHSYTGLSFQLATLDSDGQLHLWVVVEVLSPDPHGSDSDLGLVPRGQVKLVKSSSLNISGGLAYCLQFRPGDTNHLYVGSDMGCIHHRTRYGRRPIPRTHIPQIESGVCDVLTLSFCPWQPDLFLAGYSNGSISLYHINRVHPLVFWPYCMDGNVVKVQWITHKPGVFLVQDSNSTIHLWDLLKNEREPIYKHTLKEKCTYLSLHQPPSSTLHMLTPSHTYNPPTLTLASGNGNIAIHQLKDSGKSSGGDKLTAFENYINKIFIEDISQL